MSAANATDPTDSQSIERTPDFTERKLSTTQTTKLEIGYHDMSGDREFDLVVNEWMLEQGFKWFDHSAGGYWNIDHPNGTHESVTQLVARRFYRLIQSEASRIALEAIGEDDAPDVRIEEINGIEGEYDWSSPCNQLRAEQRTKLKALTAPEGGNDHE